VAYPAPALRGIALTAFDGKRWYTPGREDVQIQAGPGGWINIQKRPEEQDRTAMVLRYTVLFQPIATDTIFAPANASPLARKSFLGG
jgi:hypothetical protein